MSLVENLNAIVARLSTPAHPEVTSVEITPGRFGAFELATESFRAPALRVAFLGANRSKANANEQRSYDGAFAVFIVTDARHRLTEGMELAEWVAARMTLFSPGIIGVGVARDQRIEAIYTADVDSKGVSLHGVAWVQTVRIGTDVIDAGVHDFDDLMGVDPSDAEITVTDLPEGI